MHIFSGKHKNRSIQAPKGMKTRPTSGRLREAIFNICQSDIESAVFLDLFAGSGAIGLEALSRGASQVTFVDNSKESIRCINDNISHLKEEDRSEVLYGDVILVIEKLKNRKRQFDIIYVDPPYDSLAAYSEKVIKLIDTSNLLKQNGTLFIEDSTAALPKLEGLLHLTLKSSRSMGRSALLQYFYSTCDLSHA